MNDNAFDNQKYFYISGVVSFFIYILFVFVILLYLNKSHAIKYNSISKDTILELDLIVGKKDIDKKSVSKTTPTHKDKTAIFKKSKASSAKQKTNLKSLFARVSTKSIKIREKSVMNIKGNQVNSRFKSKFAKKKKIKKINLSKLVDVKKAVSSQKKIAINSKGNFDKYYSKIHNILITRWYSYPLLSPKKYKVTVEIIISPQGKFSYNILSLSGIQEVDEAVKNFLENESHSFYPKPFDNKTKVIKVNLKPGN